MKDRFAAVGSCQAWLCLLLGSIVGLRGSSGAVESCPPGAVAPGVQISITAYRADGTTPIGRGTATVGETIVLRSCIYHVPMDPQTLNPLSAVEQGTLAITFNGAVNDVTPKGGIPVIGAACMGVMMVASESLAYVVTAADAVAGALVARADYTGGIPHLSYPVNVGVSTHARVSLAQPQTAPVAGRLTIQKTGAGSTLLSFTGQLEKVYRVEASANLADWTALGTVSPNAAGHCELEDGDAHLHAFRFYRYVTEN